MSNWNPYIWVTASCIDNLVILGDKTRASFFLLKYQIGTNPNCIGKYDKYSGDKTFRFCVLISLVFGNFSNERGCISSESAHTWSLKVRRLTCRNFEQSLIGEVRMLCFPRVVQIPRPTRCHIMVCTYFSHELTNTVLGLQIPCKLGESKHEK